MKSGQLIPLIVYKEIYIDVPGFL